MADENQQAQEQAQQAQDGQQQQAQPSEAERIRALEGQLQKMEQVALLQQERLNLYEGQRREQPQRQEEQPQLDPDIDRALSARERALLQRIEGLTERVDASEFRSTAAQLGLDAEEQRQADQLYRNWKAQGVNCTRQDAMRYVLGFKAEQEKAQGKKNRQPSREERAERDQAMNVERPGGSPRRPAGLDPGKMSRKDRLDKYYGAVLDEEGF